jgi:hypothetical protein
MPPCPPPAAAEPSRPVWCPADQLAELADLLMRDAEQHDPAPDTESAP